MKPKLLLDELIKYVPSEKIPVSKIKFDSNNPNQMIQAQVDGLEKFMERIGFAVEVWLNKQKDGTYLVIDGEWRVRILQKRKIQFVWAKIFEVPYAEIRIMRQLANKIGGIHDKKKDAEEFLGIKEADLLDEFSQMLGTPVEEFEKAIQNELSFIEKDVSVLDELKTENKCPKCGYEW